MKSIAPIGITTKPTYIMMGKMMIRIGVMMMMRRRRIRMRVVMRVTVMSATARLIINIFDT